MLEPMKKHLIEVKYIGTKDKIEKLNIFANNIGLKKSNHSSILKEMFPEFKEEEYPSVALRGARGKEGITQKELSQKTKIPQGHISAMERGKRTIGLTIAKKLGKALNISYKVFL